MAKTKLTKKEYSRKRVFVAFVIFFAVALVATGIAIWLLFGQLSRRVEGGITVSQVATSPLSFSSFRIDDVEIAEGEMAAGFVFDTAEYDDDGRVSWNGVTSEKMSIKVYVLIMNAQHLKKFSYSLALPDGVIEAARKGYLDISDYYDMETGLAKVIEVPLSEGLFVSDNVNSAWSCTFEVTIRWGSRFGGINPSIYFDTLDWDESANAWKTSEEEIIEILDDLRHTVNGNSHAPTYTLTVTASPNN